MTVSCLPIFQTLLGRSHKIAPILCKTLKILHLSFYEKMALLFVVLEASLYARNCLVGNLRIFKVFSVN
jgi:hypothetical protein